MTNFGSLLNLVLPNLDRSRRQLSNDTKIVKFGQNLVQKFLISQILTWVLGCIPGLSYCRARSQIYCGSRTSKCNSRHKPILTTSWRLGIRISSACAPSCAKRVAATSGSEIPPANQICVGHWVLIFFEINFQIILINYFHLKQFVFTSKFVSKLNPRKTIVRCGQDTWVLRIFFKILVMRANFGDFGNFPLYSCSSANQNFWFLVKFCRNRKFWILGLRISNFVISPNFFEF